MDQELQDRVEASRASWYERAAAAGITAPPAADSWAALNPGADWAAGEDRAADLARFGDDHSTDTSAEADVA